MCRQDRRIRSVNCRIFIRFRQVQDCVKEEQQDMKKRVLIAAVLCMLLLAVSAAGVNAEAEEKAYQGIRTESPDWIGNLEAAASADQMLVVAAFNETATDAWVSLHEKQDDGTWLMLMTSPGFVGKNRLGKTK